MTNASNAAAAAVSNNQEEGSKSSFRPTSTVTIIPTSIVKGEAKNGSPYVTMRGAVVSRANKDNVERTVMAFAEQLEAVEDKLIIGESVQVRVLWNRNTLKIVGLPGDEAEESDLAQAA